MLVSFEVENWTCFRDRQHFSLETTKGAPDEYAFNTDVSLFTRLNRASVIFGPNGSGKSRFVDALAFAKRFVLFSAQQSQVGESTDVQPFLYDTASSNRPSSFGFVFIEKRVTYEYRFAVDSKRIMEEHLFVRPPGGRRQHWISREYHSNSATYNWTFGMNLRGSRGVWREATRENALFVSTAVQLNSDSLRPIIRWFRKLAVVSSSGITPSFTSRNLNDNPEFKTRLVRFLRQMDIFVSDIRVNEKEFDFEELGRYLPPSMLKDIENIEEMSLLMPEFGLPVKGSENLAFLDLDKQSDGTQRVFAFAGPWLDVVERSRVVVVDELDRSLHPHLVQFLIRFINHSRATLENRAQLIATVHDTQLLENALDRRQVWFTEKHLDQTATLIPLASFKPRSNESLRRGYLGGRYGAVPNVAESEGISEFS